MLHTVAHGGGSGHPGLYRLETQVVPGNGGLKVSGLGLSAQAKEAVKIGFDSFEANAAGVSASIKPGEHDYHLHVVDPHERGPTSELTLATFTAICCAAMARPVQTQMVVLGNMSRGGALKRIDHLPEALQLAHDAGGKRVLLSMSSVAQIPTIPGELFAKFQTGFYADAKDADFKAVGND